LAQDDPTLSRVINENLQAQKRFDLIDEMEGRLSQIDSDDNVRVITHIADESMNYKDVKAVEDMLQAVDSPSVLYLLINSFGGDPETALRTIHMCRERSDSFKTIVPDMAKSAATQVCLGSEKIGMGYNSELGPIDPQIPFQNDWTAAYTIKEGMEYIEDRAKENPDVPTQIYSAIAQHYTPAKLKEAEKAIEYIEQSATDIAGNMFDNDQEARDCVEYLLELEPHGKSISLDEARNLGLEILDLRTHDRLWNIIWEYYIRADRTLRGNPHNKIWETTEHNIAFQAGDSE